MAELTGISWSDSTFNPWIGCTKVSPACDHCYAERLMDHRMHKVQWGAGQPRQRTSAANWRQPLRWNSRPFFACADWSNDCAWRGEGDDESCRACGGFVVPGRRRVFCASLADVFDNEVPEHWRWDLFRVISATPHLDWLLLTKRIGNARAMLNSAAAAVAGEFVGAAEWDRMQWPNIWLGATICNQEEADRDIPKLLAVPAAKRFVSIEPMLGPVELRTRGYFNYCERPDRTGRADGTHVLRPPLDWIIAGGESGPQARPLHPDWVRSLRDQCAAAGVPFHFKQWGEWAPGNGGPGGDLYPRDRTKLESGMFTYSGAWTPGGPNPFRQTMDRVGTKAAGRLLDGMEHNGFPS